MPRPNFPPTPQASTDISAKSEAQLRRNSSDNAFELPPPAYSRDQRMMIDINDNLLPASPEQSPTSATARTKIPAKRPSPANDAFVLPPPPTRSRKIIQMKPEMEEKKPARISPANSKTAGRGAVAKTGDGGSKKKQPSATSVAGRKIARKTAHSLIERRRRSKMNEEFGVLKDMIPACRGHEMHKLAILQASIDYLRYLEQCIKDLKTSPIGGSPRAEEDLSRSTSYSSGSSRSSEEEEQYHGAPGEIAFSSPVSPAIVPQIRRTGDVDREATEALLMLNTDRRESGTRGLSVRDLLSS